MAQICCSVGARFRSMFALLLMVGMLAPAAGCKKSAKLPVGKVTAEAKALLEQLPRDSKIVFGFDAASVRSSEIYQTFLAKKFTPPDKVATIKQACGIDLDTVAAHGIVAATGEVESLDEAVVAIRGGLDQAQVAKCLEGQAAAVSWPKPDLLMAARTEEILKAQTTSPDATANQLLMELIGKVDTGAALWAAGWFPASMQSLLADLPGEPGRFYFQAVPTAKGVDLVVGLPLSSADVASSTAEAFEVQRDEFKKAMPDPKLGEIIGRIAVMHAGPDVAFRLELSTDDVEHLIGMASMVEGSFGL